MVPSIEIVGVPGAEDMDDATFFMHLNKRHAPDLPLPVTYSPAQTKGLTNTWRAFHRRVHANNEYEHDHEGEN